MVNNGNVGTITNNLASGRRQFYAHLAKKQDKGSALRRAKIDLLKKYGDQALPLGRIRRLLGGLYVARRGCLCGSCLAMN